MNDTVVIAIISGLCVAVPNLLATISGNNKSQMLMNYKLDELSKRVEKHNKVIERTYELEEQVLLLKEKMKIYHGGKE